MPSERANFGALWVYRMFPLFLAAALHGGNDRVILGVVDCCREPRNIRRRASGMALEHYFLKQATMRNCISSKC